MIRLQDLLREGTDKKLYVDMGGVLFTPYRGDTGETEQEATYIGDALWQGIKTYSPIILSAASSTKARSEKLAQIQEHLRPVPTAKFVNTGAAKAAFAAGGNVLVDDKQDNVTAWEAAGGVGILHDARAVQTSIDAVAAAMS